MMKERKVNKNVGRNLEKYMMEVGLFDWQLALMLGCERKRIMHWRLGKSNIPASELYELAKFFNVSVDSFFDESEETGKLKRPILTDYSMGFRDAMYYIAEYGNSNGDISSFIEGNINYRKGKNDGCRQSMA